MSNKDKLKAELYDAEKLIMQAREKIQGVFNTVEDQDIEVNDPITVINHLQECETYFDELDEHIGEAKEAI